MNLTPGEIMNILQSKNRQLSDKNDDYITLSFKRAEAERDYKIAYAEQMLRLKTDGTPVTMLKDVVSGNRGVADLKFKFEVATAVEKACLESMKDLRESIGSARSILTWLREEKANP